MAHALESEVENGRIMFADQKKLLELKTGMKAVLIE